MSHHVTLNSLVIQYKRSTEGQGEAARQALAALMGYSVATVAYLPDLGKDGSARARTEMLTPMLRIIASDATEIMPFETPMAEDVANGIYCNRYDVAWGGHRNLETFSNKHILIDTFGEQVFLTVTLWAERFLEAVAHYYREELAKRSK